MWELAHGLEMCEVDDNIFSFKFFGLGDWNKVMHQGPWLFKSLMVVIAEYDGLCNPSEVKLEHLRCGRRSMQHLNCSVNTSV